RTFLITNWIIVALIIILGIVFLFTLFTNSMVRDQLPDTLRERVESTSLKDLSLIDRTSYLSDALKISVDYPIFGTGGGGWAALYPKYQSTNYISNQAHFFLLQYLVEVGWVGLIIILFFIVSIFFYFIRDYTSQ